ncbi:hypothetical protein [Novipirellula aureliae]|uniref:hypothetical protein n=1 Tax=Novipirellula aureliae TaxID=2527966 RepID=UPI0018CF3772|nr:hypothetical protein [Novipirellula aureliae]
MGHFTYAYDWNPVCVGGLLIGALAVAEHETARFVVPHALKHLPTAIGSYGPDGVWPDGVWPDGVWPDGVWPDGVWPDGVWVDGIGYKNSQPATRPLP